MVTDFAARMERTLQAASAAGMAGVLVSPGPDLSWLTGYQPPTVTERLTMLVLAEGSPATLIVPALVTDTGAKRLNNSDRRLAVVN
jgi:D-alanyl-D-alanine dipeptidase